MKTKKRIVLTVTAESGLFSRWDPQDILYSLQNSLSDSLSIFSDTRFFEVDATIENEPPTHNED